MESIPFDEISAGSNAKLTIIDSVQYLSIQDIIMHIGNQTAKYASSTWGRLPADLKKEIETEVRYFQFPGQGKKLEPVITFKGALKLIMWVGGKHAKKYRSKMASILIRYYAGDDTLNEQIQANAQSSAPLAQMARAALVEEHAVGLPNKRKLEELAIAKLEAEIQAKQAETKAKLAESEARRLHVNHEHIAKCTAGYHDMCRDTVMDERAKLIFKDLYLNMAMPEDDARRITINKPNDPGPSSSASKPITVSQVAGSMGMLLSKSDRMSIGIELSKRYVAKHGKLPPKHEKLFDGQVIMVNSYTEEDRPLVEQVLRWHADGRV